MAERKRRDERGDDLAERGDLGGQGTMGGSKPGAAPTGLRHESGITSGGAAAPPTEGIPPSGALGGSGTGAGGLGTGPAGTGGTRNLVHGAGRPTYGPSPRPASDVVLPTDDTAPIAADHTGALGGEASSRTGATDEEPQAAEAPTTTIRGAGSGRRYAHG